MTIYSMTAFSRQGDYQANYQWTWEVRSVNHRYLDLQFKLPESCRHLEIPLRNKLKAKLKRGKVDVTLQLKLESGQNALVINEAAAHALISAVEQMQQLCQSRIQTQALSTADLLAWPGILSNNSDQNALPEAQMLDSFDTALTTLLAQRAREGEALASTLHERLPEVRKISDALRKHAPAIIENQRNRLLQRINDLQQNGQHERIEQELAIYAQRIDIDEEIDRLQTHITAVEGILEKGGHVGRRLDFLMQELNREANTIGSKSAQVATGQAAIDLKVLIEQMREQVQNLE